MRLRLRTKVLHRGMLQESGEWMPMQEEGRRNKNCWVWTRVQFDDTLDGYEQRVVKTLRRKKRWRHQSMLSMWREALTIHRRIKSHQRDFPMLFPLERDRQAERHGEQGNSSQTCLEALHDEIWGFKHHCFAYRSTADYLQELLSTI